MKKQKKQADPASRFILKIFSLADLVTLGNLSCGVLAVFFAASGRGTLASYLLLISVLLDAIDGRVARKFRSSILGNDLDSLADLVSFGVAPAVLAYTIYPVGISPAIYVLFTLAGAVRLARFNVQKTDKGFYGMPITVNGIVIPAAYLLSIGSQYFPYFFVILSFLMLSRFKIKKPFEK